MAIWSNRKKKGLLNCVLSLKILPLGLYLPCIT
uniref:Uncharacterized protein n=1 Tax=Salmonella phage PMBT27 TaxID=3137285 RepID=A0AAU8BVD7_9VIRU